MEAQLSDDANDTTDEESSVYSGLEDDEEDDSDLGSFDEGDNEEESDEEDEDDENDDNDSEEEDEGDDSSAEEMSTNEDENLDISSLPANGKTTAVSTEGESIGTSIAQLKPIEDEYAHDSSDEEVKDPLLHFLQWMTSFSFCVGFTEHSRKYPNELVQWLSASRLWFGGKTYS